MIDRISIETDRLRLEPVEPRHAQDLWDATRASLDELRRWMFWAPAADLDSTREFAEEAVREWVQGTAFQFVMLDRDGVAGALGLDVPLPVRRLGEIGYWVRSGRARRGYASEAARAVVRFGFDTVGLYRIELRAGTENLASQRVADKLGFVREGTLRRGGPHGSSGYDCHLYGLLATDSGPGTE